MVDKLILEEWRGVEGFEGLYEVSNLGRIKSLPRHRGNRYSGYITKERILLGNNCGEGYLWVEFHNSGCKSGCYVHALVCKTFHGPKPSPKHEVAHWDGNRKNNQAINVRWATSKENHKDRERHGTILKGEANGNAKLTKIIVTTIRNLKEAGLSDLQIANELNIGRAVVHSIVTKRSWAWLD